MRSRLMQGTLKAIEQYGTEQPVPVGLLALKANVRTSQVGYAMHYLRQQGFNPKRTRIKGITRWHIPNFRINMLMRCSECGTPLPLGAFTFKPKLCLRCKGRILGVKYGGSNRRTPTPKPSQAWTVNWAVAESIRKYGTADMAFEVLEASK